MLDAQNIVVNEWPMIVNSFDVTIMLIYAKVDGSCQWNTWDVCINPLNYSILAQLVCCKNEEFRLEVLVFNN